MSTMNSDNAKAHPIQLLLPCEGGSIPYLTPHMIQHYFNPVTNPLVSSHLILGFQISDSCIVPTYGPRKVKLKKKKINPRSVVAPAPSSQDKENVSALNTKKPMGYTFQGRNLSGYFRIPGEFRMMSLASFDISNPSTGKVDASADHLTLDTPNGCQKMSLSLYASVLENLKRGDEEEVSLCHVMMHDQPGAKDGKKRMDHAQSRTERWVDQFGKHETLNRWYAPVLLPLNKEKSEKIAVDFITRVVLPREKQMEGVAFVGQLMQDKTWSRVERRKVLKNCADRVPEGLKKVLVCTEELDQIVDAALCGMDVIGSALPALLAREGKALVVDWTGWREEGVIMMDAVPDSEETLQPTPGRILDLNSTSFSHDTCPLLTNCECFACKTHMRAYIHHLINSKEMLAEILLFVHNLHHLLAFMRELSFARQTGREQEFANFLNQKAGAI